jgi:hypothetical protein
MPQSPGAPSCRAPGSTARSNPNPGSELFSPNMTRDARAPMKKHRHATLPVSRGSPATDGWRECLTGSGKPLSQAARPGPNSTAPAFLPILPRMIEARSGPSCRNRLPVQPRPQERPRSWSRQGLAPRSAPWRYGSTACAQARAGSFRTLPALQMYSELGGYSSVAPASCTMVASLRDKPVYQRYGSWYTMPPINAMGFVLIVC